MNGRIVVGVHRAEFKKREGRAILSDACLTEQYRTPRGALHRERDRAEQWRSSQETERRSGDVHAALGNRIEALVLLDPGKVGVQARVARPLGQVVIPLLGKQVMRNLDPIEI